MVGRTEPPSCPQLHGSFFQTSLAYTTLAPALGSVVGKFRTTGNPNGNLDVAVNTGTYQGQLLTGNGNGTFSTYPGTLVPIGLSVSPNVWSNLLTGDFNGDGIPDIAYSLTGLPATSVISAISSRPPALAGVPAVAGSAVAQAFEVPALVFTGELAGVFAIGESVVAGEPLQNTLAPKSYREIALRVAEALRAIVSPSAAVPCGNQGSVLSHNARSNAATRSSLLHSTKARCFAASVRSGTAMKICG